MFKDKCILLDQALASGIFPKLDTFPCPYRTGKSIGGVIRIVFPEFTCVCPKTGYPDFASIKLLYLPHKICIELKSWKLYLNSFRMVGAFHETVTAHIFKTITSLLSPRWAMLKADFFPRGNVSTTVLFETPGVRPKGVDVLITENEPLKNR